MRSSGPALPHTPGGHPPFPGATLPTPGEAQRAALLVVTRRRATGLLVAVTGVFCLATAFEHDASWLAWVQATAIASMVGGLADWFAVTALFRRPLGLPIPHTAIVVERKDRFAATLGTFVQESFLTPDAVVARMRVARALPRAATWLADQRNASDLAGRAADALVAGADLLRDEDVHGLLERLLRDRLDRLALAPLTGRALQQLTRDQRHQPLVEAALGSMSGYLRDHGAELHRRLGIRSPWWLPERVGDRLVGTLILRTEQMLDDMARNRDHPLREQFDASLVKLADKLQSDEAMRRRGEEVKKELLAQPAVRGFGSELWRDIKEQLRRQAAEPGSELRAKLTDVIVRTGARLCEDPALADSAQRSVDATVRLVLERFSDELKALVQGTIDRWDAGDTSRRLELLLGPDLQYIRINGTVFGALAGLALHAVAVAAS